MARTGAVGVGFIGAGMISDTYLENLTGFPDIRVIIVGDLDETRAAAQATKHGVPESGSSADVLAHPDVEIVVNLTIPAVHAEVAAAAIAAGKHVWTEKPISVDRQSGLELLAQAQAAGLRVGVAPDTILGPGVQTALRSIARGDIGTPLSAQTIMQHPGPDLFHPNPEFLFAPGGGPLFDMGPYYISTLVAGFGSVSHVAAIGSKSQQTRVIQQGERTGTPFAVDVPTHVSALVQFEGGAVSQSVFSFDSPWVKVGVVEITGTEGTMIVPDPNDFGGEVKITRAARLEELWNPVEWENIPLTGITAGRGLGVLDMARAIRNDHAHIATGELGYHVLDTLVAIDESVATKQMVAVESTVGPIPLVAEDYDPFAATL